MRPYAVITPMPHLSTILLVPNQTLSRERLTVECPTGRVIAPVFAVLLEVGVIIYTFSRRFQLARTAWTF